MAGEYKQFWMHFFKGLDSPGVSGEVMVPSIFRNETTASMSININTGFWKDFGDSSIGSQKKSDGTYSDGGGDAIRFIETLYEVEFPVAKTVVEQMLKGEEPLLPISHDYILELHNDLLNNQEALDALLTKRLFTIDTVTKYLIGWDNKLKRYTLPIMNAYGYWVNIRKYTLEQGKKMKMINHSRKKGEGGFGRARIFPIRRIFKANSIVLFEGEWDALLALSLGINAATSTGGAGVFPKGAEDWFFGKKVYLCYDNDAQGREGMVKAAYRLHGIAAAIYLCPVLPIEEPKNADFTDFIKQGYTREDFADMVLKEATLFDPADFEEKSAAPKEEDFIQTTLAQALDPGYQNQPVTVETLVVGKGKSPYTIEKTIKLTCEHANPDITKCQTCGIFNKGSKTELSLPPASSDTLLFIKAHNMNKMQAIKQKVKVPRSCDLFDMEVLEWQNVEELLISPQVKSSKAPGAITSDTHFHQVAFHIYPTKTTRIETNHGYEMNAIRTTDPWQQSATFLIQDATPLQSNVEIFRLTDDWKEKLKVFQVREGQTVREKFDEIHADLEYNVTRIYGRRDLMIAYDLVYHSVLRFKFQERIEHKGWLEALIIGDTRTGKSETAQWMCYHYQLGEYGSGEGTSIAGLLGGLQQGSGGTNWMLTWGKIPLNDRGLYVIDEVSGLPQEHIGQLSGIRSMGIAELTKIRQEKTNARTRLIWISNPRKGKALEDFEYGCEAIQALIGANEDVARFDMAVTAASGEVPEKEINMDIHAREPIPQVYTSELCNALILWAWSRNLGNLDRNNQVIFTDEAEQLILKYATEFGRTYSSKIPLVEGANHRIKLAKMATAAAARVFSTDETFEKVIVKPEHVHFVAEVQREAYDKPSMGYLAFSQKMHEQSSLKAEDQKEVIEYLEMHPELLDTFKLMKVFSFTQLQQITGYEPEILREHVHYLADKHIVSVKANGQWSLTSNGMLLIKSIRRLPDEQ